MVIALLLLATLLTVPNLKGAFWVDEVISEDRAGAPLYGARTPAEIWEHTAQTTYDQVPGYGDLFDRHEDPHELNNLWHSRPELRAELVERLLFEVIQQQSMYPRKQAMA